MGPLSFRIPRERSSLFFEMSITGSRIYSQYVEFHLNRVFSANTYPTSQPHFMPKDQVDIVIEPVQSTETEEVIDYVMGARAQIFPTLNQAALPPDLAGFKEAYLESGKGRFLVARKGSEIVATIGYLPYDHRFPQLDYSGLKVVEVVRLFVSPDQRGLGLATRLYESLRKLAVAGGIDVLYLHTHPFLPGAISFWQKHGFEAVGVEDDPYWQTTHMQSVLPKD